MGLFRFTVFCAVFSVCSGGGASSSFSNFVGRQVLLHFIPRPLSSLLFVLSLPRSERLATILGCTLSAPQNSRTGVRPAIPRLGKIMDTARTSSSAFRLINCRGSRHCKLSRSTSAFICNVLVTRGKHANELAHFQSGPEFVVVVVVLNHGSAESEAGSAKPSRYC